MRSALLSVLLSAIALPVMAQDAAIARPLSDVNEHYDASHAQTAGGVLVGILVGGPEPEAFNPRRVMFQAPPDPGQVICVRGISQDGLYWTRTPYKIDGSKSPPGATTIVLEPFTKTSAPFKSRVALLAFLSADQGCLQENTILLPERRMPGASGTLHALVNSGGRKVSVRLLTSAGRTDGTCEPIESGGRVAFNHDCRIEIPPGAADLDPYIEVELDNRLKPTTIRHPLQLLPE